MKTAAAAASMIVLLFAASEAFPLLLYANRRNICLVDIGQSPVNSTTIVTGLDDAAAVDFIYESGAIYWTDVSQEVVRRSWLNGSQVAESVVSHGLVSPDGLACDWIAHKLYWTDSETNRIEVSNLDGSFRKVLFWEDLDQPRAIVVDPLRGYVYWTDWGETAKIERAGMDGSTDTRQVLVSTEIAWPNGLAIDYEAERIYWTDGKLKYIHSCRLDGGDRRHIIHSSLQHPYAVTLSGDHLYWTDWQMRNIYSCNKSSGENRTAIVSNLYSPMDIHVFDSARQPHGDNPCSANNGGCSHLCLISPKPPFYRCACPTGIKQLSDNKTCASGASEILLLARRTDLRWISLDTPDFTDIIIPLESIQHAIALDYDPVDGLVYWTDDEARSIRRTYLNASMEEVVVQGSISNPDGIAVDWIARNLYWTDSGTDRIGVSRLNGSSHKVLIAKGLDEPRAIVVHPVGGLLFWTDWGSVPKIERSNLDGSDRIVLVKTSLGWPNGLSIDYSAEKIFWADAKTDRIEMANFDGSERVTVVSDRLPHVFGISLLGDYLYWTDWQDRSIQRVHKSTGRQRRAIVEHLADLMGIRAVSIKVPEGTNDCSYNNGNCSHLCLNRPAPKGRICACPMGQELLANGQTCIVPEAFLLYSRGIDIRRVSLETSRKLSYSDALVPVPGVKEAWAIDFDVKSDRIYWTDVKLKSISRAFVNGSTLERLVEFGLEVPNGLAIDWLAQNMYWTDSGTQRIEMSRLNGSSRKVIVWKDVKPIAIAVDPSQGYLYWSNGGEQPRLERSSLDGSGRKTIVADVGEVTGLMIDYEKQRLYWTNAKRKVIESSRLDGSDRRQIVSGISHSTSITQYDKFIYWTNAEARTIEKASKATGQNKSTVQSRLDSVTAISAFHSSRQSGWNECQINNGGCSHLCIAHTPIFRGPGPDNCVCPSRRDLEGTNITCQCPLHCACPTHYALSPDGVTCQKPSSFLLYSYQNATSRVLVGGENGTVDMILPIQGMYNVRASEFDPVDDFIYWIDGKAKVIYRIRDNGTELSPVNGLGPTMQNKSVPFDIAIDPYARTLYWSDSHANVISVSCLDGTPIGVIVREGQPRLIALAPEDGYLFWTNAAKFPKVPKIERAHLDGTTILTLFNTGLGSLGAIAVDVQSQTLFWVDLDLRKIECSDFDGLNRHILVDEDLGEPSGLAVFGNHLYWVDRYTMSLEKVNKTNGRGREVVVQGEYEMTDLVVVANSSMDASRSPCGERNGGCSHLCVVNRNDRKNERRCSCPIGLQLATDDRTCGNPPSCNPDQFTCASGFCIPVGWHCDGSPECDDASDEVNCSRCTTAQFRCDTGQCVHHKQRCDGRAQCGDESDERNCLPPCREGLRQCVDDRVCIGARRWCDKTVDCVDGSDESDCDAQRTMNYTGPITTMPYAIGIGIVGTIVIVVVFLVLIVCLCRQKSRMLAVVDDRYKIVMVAKPSNLSLSQRCDSTPRLTPACYSQPLSLPSVVQSVGGGGINAADTESTLYDRNHITGASSSSSSVLTQYPREMLNPPPSPVTERSSQRTMTPSLYYARKSKRNVKAHGARLHKRPRKHIPPPPTTPCSTDVCEDSEPCSCRHGPLSVVADFGYESDLLCPPPPTPRSHYLSDDLDVSCPPSPSTEKSFFLPYPPPPPASVFSCSDS